ncbi:hypothetical protein HanRHA438_Chr11g0526281 [Helianthus annuus]|nr:hypothetical protein HanRHA438_Chr11g0526281 [Helianthus annuus]
MLHVRVFEKRVRDLGFSSCLFSLSLLLSNKIHSYRLSTVQPFIHHYRYHSSTVSTLQPLSSLYSTHWSSHVAGNHDPFRLPSITLFNFQVRLYPFFSKSL